MKLFAISRSVTKLDSPSSPGTRLLSPGEFGFGSPDSDGCIYAALAADQTVDVTPKAKVDYYTGSAGATEVKLQIFDANIGEELTDKTTVVITGQQRNLYCVISAPTAVQATGYQWTIPGYAVSNYVITSASAMVYSNFVTTLSNVVFYWVDGATNRAVTCSATVRGQKVVAKATFNILRPTIDFNAAITGAVAVDGNYHFAPSGNIYLHFGGSTSNGVVNNGITCISTNVNVYGIDALTSYGFSVVQLVQGTWGSRRLDGSVTNNQYNALDNRYPAQEMGDGNGVFTDSPAIGGAASASNQFSKSESFRTVLMFEAFAPSVPVPMKEICWNWSGIGQTNGSGAWILLNASSAITVNNHETFTFPSWTNVVYSTGY